MDIYDTTTIFHCLHRSEQLLRERMRATGNGITNYDYINESDSIVVYGSHCVVIDRQRVRYLLLLLLISIVGACTST